MALRSTKLPSRLRSLSVAGGTVFYKIADFCLFVTPYRQDAPPPAKASGRPIAAKFARKNRQTEQELESAVA
jgi:hypothetical protein